MRLLNSRPIETGPPVVHACGSGPRRSRPPLQHAPKFGSVDPIFDQSRVDAAVAAAADFYESLNSETLHTYVMSRESLAVHLELGRHVERSRHFDRLVASLARPRQVAFKLKDDHIAFDAEAQAFIVDGGIEEIPMPGSDLRLALFGFAVAMGSGAMSSVIEPSSVPVSDVLDDGRAVDPRELLPPTRISVGDLLNVESVGRLSESGADRLRADLEPFLGWVQTLVHDGKFRDSEQAQVAHELKALRQELYGDSPMEPLGAVLQGYFASLLDQAQQHLSVQSLESSASDAAVNADAISRVIDAGTVQAAAGEEARVAVGVADALQDLAPDIETGRSRATWAAVVLGWVSDSYRETVTAAGATAGISSVLDLAWMPLPWAAAVGATVGMAGAIAKVRGEDSRD